MSVAIRLGGFVLLVGVVFLVAYLVGASVGPVTPVHGKGGGGMTMSTAFVRSAPGAGAVR